MRSTSRRRTVTGSALLSAVLVAGAFACGFDGVGSLDAPGPGGPAGEAGVGPGSEGGGPEGQDGATTGEGGSTSGDAGDASTACTRDGGGAGVTCGAECVDTAHNRLHCGGCSVACNETSACEGSCVSVASALHGLRYELPCLDGNSPYCNAGNTPAAKVVTIAGTAGKSYTVTIRVRGVVEQKTYNGEMTGNAQGTNAAFFVAGGSPANDLWNAYSFKIATPSKTFYLNGGSSGHDYVDAVDYTAAIIAAAGTSVTLDASSSDSNIARNRDQANGTAIIIPSIKPAPQAFNGQFVQIDVLTVAPAP